MREAWQRLQMLVKDGDVAGTRSFIAGLDDNDRQDCGALLARHLDYETYWEDRVFHNFQHLSLGVALAALAPSPDVFVEHRWHVHYCRANSPDLELIVDVLLERDVEFLRALPRELVRPGRFRDRRDWDVVRSLVRRGVMKRPTEDWYFRGILALRRRDAQDTIDEFLADPGLLEIELYEFLAITTDAPEPGGHIDFGDGWSRVISTLVRIGHLDRDRVLDICLTRLVDDVKWHDRRWHARLLSELGPTRDELSERRRLLMQLLQSTASPAIALAQDLLAPLLDAHIVDMTDVIDASDVALTLGSKAVALKQLRLVDRSIDDPALADRAVKMLATTFGHPRIDVQSAALTVVGRRRATFSVEQLADLLAGVALLAPSLAGEARAVLGAAPQVKPVGAAWSPAPPWTMLPPLDDDVDFVRAAVTIIGGELDSMRYERVLEGLLSRAADSPDDLRGRLSPALSVAKRRDRMWMPAQRVVAVGLSVLVGLEHWSPSRSPSRSHHALVTRDMEVIDRIARRSAGPLLSMPTSPTGRIERSALRKRRQILGCDTHFSADDLIAAIRAGEIAEPPVGPLGAPPARPLSMPGYWDARHAAPIELTATMWPHDPDRAVDETLVGVQRFNGSHSTLLWMDAELDAKGKALAVSPQLLAWLCQPGVPAADQTSLVIAVGTGSAAKEVRSSTIDAFITLERDGRVDRIDVARSIASLAGAEMIKLNRVARAFDQLSDVDPTLARDTLLAIFGEAAESGIRDMHLLISACAEAVAATGPTDAPQSLRSLADRRGSSKLLTEARRLLRVLDPSG